MTQTANKPRGIEKHGKMISKVTGGTIVWYDYLMPSGDVFSTVGLTLANCRKQRDAWLAAR